MLNDTAKEALKACIATRGPHKGKLKANAPPSNSLAYAAWQGAMLSWNPFKASIAGIMFMSDEQRAVMRNVETWADANKHLRFADRDRAALETIGAW